MNSCHDAVENDENGGRCHGGVIEVGFPALETARHLGHLVYTAGKEIAAMKESDS